MALDYLPPPPMLTAGEADLLRVPRRTIYSWVDQGLLPCHKVGPRLIRFSSEDVSEFLRRSDGSAR